MTRSKPRPWTAGEDEEMCRLIRAGNTVKQIAELLGRTELSVQSRRDLRKFNFKSLGIDRNERPNVFPAPSAFAQIQMQVSEWETLPDGVMMRTTRAA